MCSRSRVVWASAELRQQNAPGRPRAKPLVEDQGALPTSCNPSSEQAFQRTSVFLFSFWFSFLPPPPGLLDQNRCALETNECIENVWFYFGPKIPGPSVILDAGGRGKKVSPSSIDPDSEQQRHGDEHWGALVMVGGLVYPSLAVQKR